MLRLTSVHLTNHMSLKHDWNKWKTKVQSLVRRCSLLPRWGKGPLAAAMLCDCVFFAVLYSTSELRSPSLSYYVRQSMRVVEGLPSSNIWVILPSSKGASGNWASSTCTSGSGLKIWCSYCQSVFEDILVADRQFRHFSEALIECHEHILWVVF